MLGFQFPDVLRERLGALRTHPFKALWLARMAPVSTGMKNYAMGLLPPEDLPLKQYAAATFLAHLMMTTWVCVIGANAESLVEALDHAGIKA